jgi:hypothetical protein
MTMALPSALYDRDIIQLATKEQLKETLKTAYQLMSEIALIHGNNPGFNHYNGLKDSIDGLMLSDRILILQGGSGIGYLNLRNRVAYLNGMIDIQTAAGRGTSVNIEISLTS